jgi:hypothetical protein
VVLSKRERYIAIGVIAVVVILALDQIILEPFLTKRSDLAKADTEAMTAIDHGNDTLAKERKLRPIWTAMQAGGLKADPATAESQFLHALRDWAQESQLTLTALKPERNAIENKFQLISYRATATGSMRSITEMLWRIETAPIPVRINDLEITPRKEGTDDLSVQFGVSTLSQLPEAKPAGGGRENR